jgi:hypothetical protein
VRLTDVLREEGLAREQLLAVGALQVLDGVVAGDVVAVSSPEIEKFTFTRNCSSFTFTLNVLRVLLLLVTVLQEH